MAYTDPEVAWVGLTEAEADGSAAIAVEKASFPWVASGRALGIARSEGLTKLLFEAESRRLLGAGIVGVHAGELIAELALAIELGADVWDVALTVHPHPRLSETVGLAAEVAAGTSPTSSRRGSGRAARLRRRRRRDRPTPRGCSRSPARRVFLLGAGLGGDFRAPGETPIADVIQVLVLDRELVAIDGLAGTDLRIDLERGETVLSTEARGRVAIALTDRRILACAVRSAAWQQERYRRGEAVGAALVGEQVAVIVTPKRAIGFDSRSRNLIDTTIGPNERVLAVDASGAVGVVVTDRRVLGISPFAGGFFTAGLGPGEVIDGRRRDRQRRHRPHLAPHPHLPVRLRRLDRGPAGLSGESGVGPTTPPAGGIVGPTPL